MSKKLLGVVPNTSMHLISDRMWDFWNSKYTVTFTATVRNHTSCKKIWGEQ